VGLYLTALGVDSTLQFSSFRSTFYLLALSRIVGDISRVFGIRVTQTLLLPALGVLVSSWS
jgi:hypothetical protein